MLHIIQQNFLKLCLNISSFPQRASDLSFQAFAKILLFSLLPFLGLHPLFPALFLIFQSLSYVEHYSTLGV